MQIYMAFLVAFWRSMDFKDQFHEVVGQNKEQRQFEKNGTFALEKKKKKKEKGATT